MSRRSQQVDEHTETVSSCCLYMHVNNKVVSSVCKFCARTAGVDGF
jgi:hypothetical protein